MDSFRNLDKVKKILIKYATWYFGKSTIYLVHLLFTKESNNDEYRTASNNNNISVLTCEPRTNPAQQQIDVGDGQQKFTSLRPGASCCIPAHKHTHACDNNT